MGCGSSTEVGPNGKSPTRESGVTAYNKPQPQQRQPESPLPDNRTSSQSNQTSSVDDKERDKDIILHESSSHLKDKKAKKNEEKDLGQTSGKTEADDEPALPLLAEVDDAEFLPFVEFPTAELLREANEQYHGLKKPVPRDNEGQLLPYPTYPRKQDVFRLEDFAQIDDHAIKAPESLRNEPIQALVNYLTKPSKRHMDIVRVILRWVTAQNLAAFPATDNGQGEDTDTAHYWLSRIKQEREDYNDLFAKMCTLAGIQCRTLGGYAKGASYEPGEDTVQDTWVTWAAVAIDGCWYHVDAHWASRHVVGGGHGEWELIDDNGEGAKEVDAGGPYGNVYQCNEAYFLTNPEEMIYYHYPKEAEDWQLLARKVTQREFSEMAYVKPGFFELGLRLLEQRKCVLQASEGEIEIEIGLTPGTKRNFMYRLWKSSKGKDKSSNFKDTKLDRFALMQQRDGILSCRLFFPEKGKYKIELFGTSGDDATSSSSRTYQFACAYIVLADKAMEDCHALPENARKEWGPGQDLENAGLTAITHTDGIIESEDGTAEVRFKADRAVDLIHTLHSNTMTKEQLKNYVIHRIEGDEVILNIKLPEQGDYALNLFAKDEEAAGSLENVCSYVVSTANPAFDSTPFPTIPNGRTGATTENKGIGLKPLSHESPFIEVDESGEVDIIFGKSKPVNVSTKLEHQTSAGAKLKDNCVFHSQGEDQVKFKAQFPEPGAYVLKIFANDENGGDSLSNVFNYVIHVNTPKENCLPFPETLHGWTDGCVLKEQTHGVLPSDTKLPFSLRVPQAHKVAAIGSTGWTHLEKDDEGYWRGEVDTGSGQPLKISAELEEESGTFSTLLKFEVKATQEINKDVDKQKQATKKASEAKKKEEDIRRKRESDFANAKNGLLAAMKGRDLAALRKALKNVENRKYVQRLKDEVKEAKNMVKSLERIEKLQVAILQMDQKTMAEIRNYRQPPALVHEVMIVTLLLLGEHEGLTRDWKECQKLCNTIGPTGLNRRVKDFDVQLLNPEIAARGMQILQRFHVDDVRDKSAGAGTFCAWALGMIEEVRVANDEARKAKPAGLKRQKYILDSNAGRRGR